MSSREWKRIKTSTHSAHKHVEQELSEASEAHMVGFPVLSRRLPPVAATATAAAPSTMEERTHTSPEDVSSIATTYDPLLFDGAPREELAMVAQLDGEVLQTRDDLSARQLEQAETLIALCALLQQSTSARERPTELELKDGPITLFAIAFDARFAFIDLVQSVSERQRVRERAQRMHTALLATHGAL